MEKCKETPKYNVVSIRVNDDEKAFLDELTRRDRTTINRVMREAFRSYLPQLSAMQERR